MVDQQNDTEAPPISVVISTCNRGCSIVATIKGVLLNDYPDFVLYVVDQSDTDVTDQAVQQFLADPRFCYIRIAAKGLGVGHNVGIGHALTELIAVTDDDCDVPGNWLSEMVNAFHTDPNIGVVFGNVEVGEHDRTRGYIDADVTLMPFLKSDLKGKNPIKGIGMGACFGLRRSAWRKTGGFDEMLGPGAPLRGFEEADFALRVLLAGFLIYKTPTVRLIHNGFRTYDQGRELASRNWYGIGAGCAKLLKCAQWSMLPVTIHYFFGIACKDFLSNVFLRHRLAALRPITAFTQGFAIALITPVDRVTLKFLARRS